MTATVPAPPPLADLYLADETAWLDAMAALAKAGDAAALDLEHLGEYLSDKASRDRREVFNRMVVLLAHVLKWWHQPDRRTASWRLTIHEQSERLARLAGAGVLRAHAATVLAEAYRKAVEQAALETRLPPEAFPADCLVPLEELLAYRVADDQDED